MTRRGAQILTYTTGPCTYTRNTMKGIIIEEMKNIRIEIRQWSKGKKKEKQKSERE